MVVLLPGPVPQEANVYWVDEKTVPQYIKQQRGLMRLVVRPVLPRSGLLALMGEQWKKVPPALVFVHIPVSPVRRLKAVARSTLLAQVQKADILAPLYVPF